MTCLCIISIGYALVRYCLPTFGTNCAIYGTQPGNKNSKYPYVDEDYFKLHWLLHLFDE